MANSIEKGAEVPYREVMLGMAKMKAGMEPPRFGFDPRFLKQAENAAQGISRDLMHYRRL